MKSTQHPSNNAVLRAPAGASVEECRPLAITRVQFSNGVPAVFSFWQPSEEERVSIAAGAMVRLSVLGYTHPPVAIGVDGLEES